MSRRVTAWVVAAVLALVFAAVASAFLYDPPAEQGTVSYDAPPVDVPFTVNPDPVDVPFTYDAGPVDVPFTVDPPESCGADPPAVTQVVDGVSVTVDRPAACFDPEPVTGSTPYDADPVGGTSSYDADPVNGIVTYDAPTVDVPYTHDPPPREVTEPPPPPPGETLILPDNQTFVCGNYPQPVDYALVKIRITQQSTRQDAMRTGDCTGRIGRLEIDTWNADGIHVGPTARDLVIEGGYVRSHGVCTSCGTVHVDGIQVLGGVNVTFRNLEITYPTATNAAFFVGMGANAQQLPTDVVCDGCTIRRSPEDNRTVRIYTSLRSGVRNSTVYWCGTGPGCGAGQAIATIPETQQLVNENNTLLLSGG